MGWVGDPRTKFIEVTIVTLWMALNNYSHTGEWYVNDQYLEHAKYYVR